MAYIAPTIKPSGTTFAQFQAAGATGQLERLIAANFSGTSAPTAPTVNATGGGTGGSLAAGTYYVRVTETNGIGETLPSTEATFTIGAGNIPELTFAALQSGNTARNVYVGTASGAETLYATGITASTYNLSAAQPTNSFAVAPPTANSTGLVSVDSNAAITGNAKMQALRACERTKLQSVWDGLANTIDQFNRGEPGSFASMVAKLRDAHTVFAMMAQLCDEMGTLIDTNPGTFHNVPTSIGGMKTVRQWP